MLRRRLSITGVVQGVGFRPFLWRRATRLGLTGFVENTASGVVAEVQGPQDAVAAFAADLAAEAPPLAMVDHIAAANVTPVHDEPANWFQILESTTGHGPRTGVPPDIATCDACLAEMRDPVNRRHGHAFITCTDCGPRFTIIERLPYDRAATTMQGFAMCPRCAAEYADPGDRRFHAEPIACPDCGPRAWFARSSDTGGSMPILRPTTTADSRAAVAAAQDLLAGGGILAVKNLGGFHLACDATNAAAVARLRERKQRPIKPLAVMVGDLAAATRIAECSEQESRLLTRHERSIVLVRKRLGSALVDAVAPDTDFLGIMLPAAPLQHLLADGLPPLVMTSGNLAGEPMATDTTEAVGRLGTIADGFLLHDRDIHAACDDSVVRCVAGAPLPIRRSRGYAPLPIRLAAAGPTILAVGGELKATVCLAVGDRAIMSQHIGDLGSLETLAGIERAADHLLQLFDATPAAIAADLHPGYLSTEWARRFAAARGIPLLSVQHHQAHVAALMAEHSGTATPPSAAPCFVACFDGTGYWPTGSIAGGEFFLVAAGAIRRAAHVAPFPLPGGDAAIRHPWRTALALLHAAGLPWDERLPAVRAAPATNRQVVQRQLDRGLGCTPTTSMGRLFDAVAALVGGPASVTFEAEAALWLESQAVRWADPAGEPYQFELTSDAPTSLLVADWRPVVTAVVGDVLAGTPAPAIAASFHRAVACLIDDVRKRLAPAAAVGLTGGVFQNALLVEHALARLRVAGRDVLLHHLVPPNDGGLALGQALLARDRLTEASFSQP